MLIMMTKSKSLRIQISNLCNSNKKAKTKINKSLFSFIRDFVNEKIRIMK